MESISKAGAVFVVYLFIVVAAYFLLSAPVDLIFDAFASADAAQASDELSTFIPQFRTALQIFFALFLALPVTWFVFWVFHREPGVYYVGR